MSGFTAASAISLGLSAIGTGASVLGQINQQAAAGAQQGYLAQLARQRQQLAEQQARDAIQRGQVAEQKQRDLTAQRIGTQTAALAAQGTDLEGSPTDILSDTARAGEQDALTIRNNAKREAWSYEMQAAGYDADAALRESFEPSYLGAGTSLLMGASSLADKWDRFMHTRPSTSPKSDVGTRTGVTY
ncbi:virion core protein, T7 gp14 family [Reyranella sp.]|uniref:virion core protein, T7 gp14 family n=1 Tax=Reyranella sp. TaxID=1929291 RepID=UPI003D1226C7